MALYNRKGEKITISTDSMPFADKKFAFIGDSFSAGGHWQEAMINKLQASDIKKNSSISGGRWSYNADAPEKHAYYKAQQIKESGFEPNVIMCCLGSNDAGNSVTMGDIVTSNSIDEFDLTTFTGGMQACLNYLQNNFPIEKIYVGWTPSGANCNFTPSDRAEPYVERMKEVCLMYGIEYIETRTCGITKYSDIYAECWEAGVGGGHPTQTGHEYIGKYMADIVTAKV